MAGLKSILVLSLIVSMLVVPLAASILGVVKCIALCFLKFAGNPFNTVPCILKCKKSFPLDVDFYGRVDDHSLCTTGCAISNCLTTTQEQVQGLTEEELVQNCVYGCENSCKARRSNKLE